MKCPSLSSVLIVEFLLIACAPQVRLSNQPDAPGLSPKRVEQTCNSVLSDMTGCWRFKQSTESIPALNEDGEAIQVGLQGNHLCIQDDEMIIYFHQRLWLRLKQLWTSEHGVLRGNDPSRPDDIPLEFRYEGANLAMTYGKLDYGLLERLDGQDALRMTRIVVSLPTLNELNKAVQRCLRSQEQDGIRPQEEFLGPKRDPATRDHAVALGILASIHMNYAENCREVPMCCDYSRYYAKFYLKPIQKAASGCKF
jgi:hypothetical protein